MDRFNIILQRIESKRDDDGDPYEHRTDVVDATGSAAVCRAVLAEIASELGANSLQMTLGAGPAATAGEQAPAGPRPADEDGNDDTFPAADDGKPKRTRRTKAQIEADRLAAEQATAAVAPEPAPQPVDVPAPVAAPGNFGPGQPAVPSAVAVPSGATVQPLAAGVPFNPFVVG